MSNWVESHKPAARVSTQLMAAGLLWATVGAALVVLGGRWLWAALPGLAPWIAMGAAAVGTVKSRLILDRAARRVVGRIEARGDGRCLGGFLSLRTWGLVVVMMALGRLLRGTIAASVIGPLYVAVGTALVVSSRVSWRAWWASRHRR